MDLIIMKMISRSCLEIEMICKSPQEHILDGRKFK